MSERAQAVWESLLDNLSREVTARMMGVLASTILSTTERIDAAAAILAAGQRRAVTAADLHLAAELTLQLAASVPTTGLDWYETADEQTARLSGAVSAVVSATPAYVAAATAADTAAVTRRSVALRVNRLVDGQVGNAATWARGEAGVRHAEAGRVLGWIRRTDADPCELCRTLRGSPPGVHPPRHVLAMHPGRDRCSQQYVTSLEGYGPWLGTGQELRDLRAQGLASAATTTRITR